MLDQTVVGLLLFVTFQGSARRALMAVKYQAL